MKKEYYVICNTKKEFLTNQNNKLVFTKNKELANMYETQKEAIEFEDKFSNDIEGLTYIYKIKNDKIIKMGENKMSLRDFIQKSDDYFIEARDKEVSAEFRIALGKLKGIYGNDEVPTSKVLEKDIEMIIKKYNLDVSFKEYAKKNIKINESEEIEVISESMKVINKIQKLLPKTDLHIGKDGPNKEYVWTFKDYSFIRVSSSETYNRIEYYTKGGDFITSFLTVGELKSYLKSSNLLTESAVGEVGRTSKADAEAHITPELKAEFEKIIRQIGGKAVARALLDGNPDNGEISESADYSDFLSEKEVGYMVYGFGDEDDFKRVQKKFFGNGLVWGRDGSKDIKDTKVLKQLDIKSFDDLALYNEGKDMYLGNKATLYKRKDLKKIEASDIK
jgi:galactitol-specific phosphotransferase system IIB component